MTAQRETRDALQHAVRELHSCDMIPELDWSHIPVPGPQELVPLLGRRIIDEHIKPALKGTTSEDFMRAFMAHIEGFARLRRALSLVLAPSLTEEDVRRGVRATCDRVRERGHDQVAVELQASWEMIQRAGAIRARVEATSRLAPKLRDRDPAHAAFCLGWSWGHVCCAVASSDMEVNAAPEVFEAARRLMRGAARDAYIQYRSIEWDDANPTDAEVDAARRVFADMGVTI